MYIVKYQHNYLIIISELVDFFKTNNYYDGNNKKFQLVESVNMKTINEIIADKIVSDYRFYSDCVDFHRIDDVFDHYQKTNDRFVVSEVVVEKDTSYCSVSRQDETIVSISFIVDFTGEYDIFYCYVEVSIKDFCTFINDNYVKNP